MVSPDMISYEIANALSSIMKRKIIEKEHMLEAFNNYKKILIKKIVINFENALDIAWEYKIYAYDACYLEAAKRLDLPLLTFDNNMIKAAKELKINILGGNDVST